MGVPNGLTDQDAIRSDGSLHMSLENQQIGPAFGAYWIKRLVGLPIGSLTTSLSLMFTRRKGEQMINPKC